MVIAISCAVGCQRSSLVARTSYRPKAQRDRQIAQYDTIAEFNMDSKAEYSALSSTRSQKKIQHKYNTTFIAYGSPEAGST